MGNENPVGLWGILGKLAKKPAPSSPIAEHEKPVAFPTNCDGWGLPADPALRAAAQRLISNYEDKCNVDHALKDGGRAEMCYLINDSLWQVCHDRLDIPVNTALKANALLEREGGVQITVPMMSGEKVFANVEIQITPKTATISFSNLSLDKTAGPDLAQELPKIATKMTDAFFTVKPLYEAAKSEYETKPVYKPVNPREIMAYTEQEFLGWVSQRMPKILPRIQTFIKTTHDIDVLTVLKMSLANLERTDASVPSINACFQDPNTIQNSTTQLKALTALAPSSAAALILNRKAIAQAQEIQSSGIRVLMNDALRGQQYEVHHSYLRRTLTGIVETTLSALPQEFTNRVTLTDNGARIDLTDVGEAKIHLLLGAINQIIGLSEQVGGTHFVDVPTLIRNGRVKKRTLQKQEIVELEKGAPCPDLTLDSGYLESKVGIRDFTYDVYDPSLQVIAQRAEQKGAVVITLVGRTGAGKSTLAKHLGVRIFDKTASADNASRPYGPTDNLVILKYTGPRTSTALLGALNEADKIQAKRSLGRRRDGTNRGTIIVVEEAHNIRWDSPSSTGYLELGERLQNLASESNDQKRPALGVFIIGELTQPDKHSLFDADASIFNDHRFNRQLVLLKADEAETALIGLLNRAVDTSVNKTAEGLRANYLEQFIKLNLLTRAQYDDAIRRVDQACGAAFPFLRQSMRDLLILCPAFVRLTQLPPELHIGEFFTPTKMDGIVKATSEILKDDIYRFLSGESTSSIRASREIGGELEYAPERLVEIQKVFHSVVDHAIESAIDVARRKLTDDEDAAQPEQPPVAAAAVPESEIVLALRANVQLQRLYPRFGAEGVALMAQQLGPIQALLDPYTIFSDDMRLAIQDNLPYLQRILKRMTDNPQTRPLLQGLLQTLTNLMGDERWSDSARSGDVKTTTRQTIDQIVAVLGEDGIQKLRQQIEHIQVLTKQAEVIVEDS